MRRLGDGEVRRIFERLEEERSGMPQPRHAPASYQGFLRHLLVDDVDGVKVMTLRRPQAMNAFDDEVTGELLKVIVEHQDDPSVAGFVIVGYGPRAFCAGADIGRFPEVWQGEEEPLPAGGWPLLAPSAIPYREHGQVPREMTREDMDAVLADHVRAAEMAEEAGFDLLELHMAHGGCCRPSSRRSPTAAATPMGARSKIA